MLKQYHPWPKNYHLKTLRFIKFNWNCLHNLIFLFFLIVLFVSVLNYFDEFNVCLLMLDSRFIGSRAFSIQFNMYFWFAKKTYDNINFNSLIFRLFSCCTCFWIRSGYNFITKIIFFLCNIFLVIQSRVPFNCMTWSATMCVGCCVLFFFLLFPQWQAKWFRFSPYLRFPFSLSERIYIYILFSLFR